MIWTVQWYSNDYLGSIYIAYLHIRCYSVNISFHHPCFLTLPVLGYCRCRNCIVPSAENPESFMIVISKIPSFRSEYSFVCFACWCELCIPKLPLSWFIQLHFLSALSLQTIRGVVCAMHGELDFHLWADEFCLTLAWWPSWLMNFILPWWLSGTGLANCHSNREITDVGVKWIGSCLQWHL